MTTTTTCPDTADAMPGNTKVTRANWLTAAREVLVSEGVGEVKVLTLGAKLNVSRSSFYWYFKNRQHLLAELLDDWEARNTRTLIEHCETPAATISHAACNFFKCFVDAARFDQGLDFAVREWARRDPSVRGRIDAADSARITAVCQMFLRHGYAEAEAETRARILYYMQLGYHALDVREAMDVRLSRLPGYLEGFTGQPADPQALADFRCFASGLPPRAQTAS